MKILGIQIGKTDDQLLLDLLQKLAGSQAKEKVRRAVLCKIDGTTDGNAEADLCEAYLKERAK